MPLGPVISKLLQSAEHVASYAVLTPVRHYLSAGILAGRFACFLAERLGLGGPVLLPESLYQAVLFYGLDGGLAFLRPLVDYRDQCPKPRFRFDRAGPATMVHLPVSR